MNEKQDYIIIKKKIFNMMNSKNQLKYTAFMRLSFSEFTSLMTLFPLSEIVEYLSNDTGLKINYGSVILPFLIPFKSRRFSQVY